MPLDPETTFTWYGHSCFEVRTPGGRTILIDPYFLNPSSPRQPGTVTTCDILLVTHGHFDHFGEALQIASRTRPYWPTSHEMSLWLPFRYPGGRDAVVGMNKGGTVEHQGIRMTMVRADHSGGDTFGQAEQPFYLGEPVGFIVQLENGFKFYFAGDTDVFSDLRLIAEQYQPDLVFLPIGDHYTMGPRGAALAVEFLGAKDVVPIHWGSFPVLSGTPAKLRDELSKRGLDVNVHETTPGGTLR